MEGAEPGDSIVVTIVKLETNRAMAYSGSLLAPYAATPQAIATRKDSEPKRVTWTIDKAKGVATLDQTEVQPGGITLPLRPMLGCIGVAPSMGEARSTIVPGPFGGNMDCWEVRPGNTVHLGVNVPGAMLSVGDGHYAMGDGEIMGAAIEGAMQVELFVELLRKEATPVPRIENLDEVMFVGSGRPLEDAARVAFEAMIGWVRARTNLTEMDAYQFVSQQARAHIVQIVDPEYTVLVALDKARLPKS